MEENVTRFQEEKPTPIQHESMLEALERLNKEVESLKIELPTILIDEFDPCEMCGS